MSKEPVVLACSRVAHGPPSVQAVVDKCQRCSAAVWRSLSSPEAIDEIICMPCFFKAIETEKKVELHKPTPKQLRDLEGVLKPEEIAEVKRVFKLKK